MAPAPADSFDRAPVFVVLDGVDGCGKTTQARRLVEHLEASRPGETRASPPARAGSTVAGERIRGPLLDPSAPMGRGTLALLFTAARRETLESLVAPALAAGRDVVVERFHASTFAYQGGGPQASEAHGFEDEEPARAAARLGRGPAPHGRDRARRSAHPCLRARRGARAGGGDDRFESRGLEFQESVARAMRAYVERVEHAVIVDGTGTEDEVARRVLEAALPAEVRRA